ncbi:His/Glu/Gln/Arg/opine family amino acid ABC transporter permease subunit [Pseudarthrobacter defluvii]|uniref:amino acid ABC transporter permease n=1 Tax=Pseudarthrobacter defluvii TaxID=410837 RepID=UPI002786C75A|nr:amino acid ABC transporter permease [Pseudarthrobacter defluvii]MDQ0769460.1 His/Glu/Gln/Arg/opine family amino acid ABC transporter permease subunit [Pseudarthrobacter defluvii]
MTTPNFGWEIVGLYLRDDSIDRGILVTPGLTAISMAIGIVLGVVSQSSDLRPTRSSRCRYAYVNFFRGIPVLVQAVLVQLGGAVPCHQVRHPPVQLDANQMITPMMAAILGPGLNQGAYMSENVRAGILSVDHGQTEAAEALGITRMQIMHRVVLPQAMRVTIAPTGNETMACLRQPRWSALSRCRNCYIRRKSSTHGPSKLRRC